MTGTEQLVVLAAGLGAGVLTTTVGVASLLSFPVLIALGIPPVVANVSNTVGLVPGALSGSFGYRAELREEPGVTVRVLLTCAVGAVAGAVLLLALPSTVFESVAPWLILFACLLVGVQPTVSGWVRRRRTGPHAHLPRRSMSPATTFFALLTGTYGGYFGAGAGVMMVAVLGLGLDLELRVVNALKTLALLAANLVATAIFVRRRGPRLGRGRPARHGLGGGRLRRRAHRSATAADGLPAARRGGRRSRRGHDAVVTGVRASPERWTPDAEPSSVPRIRVTGVPASAGLVAGCAQTRARSTSRNAAASSAVSNSRSTTT